MMRFLCLISVCAALRPPELSSVTKAAQRTLANLPAVRTAVVDAAHRALDGCGVSVPVNGASASPEAVKNQVGAVAASLKAKTHEVTKEAPSELSAKTHEVTKEAFHELTDVVDHVRAATPSLRLLKGKKNNILKAPEERIQAEGHADVARAAMDAVLPASVALLALGAAGAAPWPAAAWALAEVCSRSYAFVVEDVGGKETVPPPSGNTRLLWRRCLENCDDVVSYVEGWFYGAQFDSLTKGDIEAWLSGNVFGAAASDHRQRRQLSWMVRGSEHEMNLNVMRSPRRLDAVDVAVGESTRLVNEHGINQRRSSASRSGRTTSFPTVHQRTSTCAPSRPRRRRSTTLCWSTPSSTPRRTPSF